MKQYLKIFFATFFLLLTFGYAKAQIIGTIAGNGSASYCGDGGAATNACLNSVWGLTVDKQGNVYLADRDNNRIRKVDAAGNITTFAGIGGTGSYNGDNIPATSAALNYCTGVAADRIGNIYIADVNNYRIRKVNTLGIITTVVGNGISGFSGDGSQATAAQFDGSTDMGFDSIGNMYISDGGNLRIRKIDTSGIITTIGGTGVAGFSGDNGLAVNAQMNPTNEITADKYGNVYFHDGDVGSVHSRIRKIDTNGIITTLTGDSSGYSGDGGLAINAKIFGALVIAVDKSGNVFFADLLNNRIRMINGSTDIINTVIGTGVNGFNGDGHTALNTEINYPYGVTFDNNGYLYFSDNGNGIIRKTDITVGIQQFKNDIQLTVYPNPSNGNFAVETNYTTEKQNLQLFDVTGKMVLSQTLNNKANINASSLDNGVYFLQVKTNQNISTQKVIVQH